MGRFTTVASYRGNVMQSCKIVFMLACLLACVSGQAQEKYLAYPYNKPAPSQDDTPYTPTPTTTSMFPNASKTIGVPNPQAPTPQAPTPQAPSPNAPNPKSAYDQPPINNPGASAQQPTQSAPSSQAPAAAVSVTVQPPDPAKQAQQDQEIKAVKDRMFQKPSTQ
jgi:hypothetical protein